MTLTRKSLEDLYEAGREYDISPHSDGTAMIYIRKLGPLQQAEAVRKANAERTKIKTLLDDKENEEYLTLVREAAEVDREEKIEQLAQTEVAEDRAKIEQEISEKEDWASDDKLQGLVDAWEGGLLEEWLKGEGLRSEESERVYADITRFNDEVVKKLEGRLKQAKRPLQDKTDDELNDMVAEAQVEYEASIAWMRTFRLYQIVFGVHDTDRNRMFDHIDEVSSLPSELFGKLVDALLDLTTPTLEVKS